MDFLALPRRDLQALCKRNGVRANMTNVVMADALRALPKVDGIEEYVKQPVPVRETEVKAVAKEKNIGKQGSLLPRGRRAAAKSSEPIEPEEDNEEEKGNAKRQYSKEDTQEFGVGRRGASRRARPVPVVPRPAAVTEENNQGEEDQKRQAKRDNAPAIVVGQRGASRCARPSPAVAAPAAESEVAGAEEEQSEEVVEEDLKREASMDDAPALGVGRHGDIRRARPASSVAAPAGNVVAEEEQRPPIPRGRRFKAKGSSTNDEQKEDAKPEEHDDAQILGVGRRGGAGRRAQAKPAVAAPEAKPEEEQRATLPRGRRVKANSTEIIRLDDSEEEKKDDMKPEERGDAPAIGVGRGGASRRAPASSEAPATRRSAAGSKAEAGDVAVDAVPIRATRQRKPTLKAAAAAAAAEKAPRRATRRGAVMSTLLQQEVQEEPQGVFSDAEAVGAPDVAVEVVPIRATRQRKPTMKAAAAAAAAKAEEKAPRRATRRGVVMRTVLQSEVQEKLQGVFSDEAVGVISYQRCDALEELEQASDPQKEELNKDEDEDVVIIEDERLMEETPAEEQQVQVGDETYHAPLATQEESPILGLVSTVTEQASEDDESANFQDGGGSSSGMSGNISQVAGEETNDKVNTEDGLNSQEEGDVVVDKVLHDSVDNTILLDCSSDISWVEVEKAGNITNEMSESQVALDEDGDKPNGVVIGDGMSQATVTDTDIQEETADEMPQGTAGMHDMEDDQFETDFVQADEVVPADMETNTEDGVSCKKEGDVVVDKVLLHDSVDNTILLVGSSDNTITSEMPENQAAVDEDGDKPDEVVIGDSMSQVTVTDEAVQEEKEVLITNEMLQGTTCMHGNMEDDQFETFFVQVDQVVTADNMPEQVTDCGITVEVNNTSLTVDEKQQRALAMDSETDGVHSSEQIEVVTTDKVPELKLIEDIFVQADQVVAADNLPEQVSDCEIAVEENTALIVDEKEQSTITMDDHADEQMEVGTTDKVPELTVTNVEVIEEKIPPGVDDKQKSTVTMDNAVVDDHFKTDVVHTNEQVEVATTDEVLELTETCDEVVEEMETPLIVDEKQQSTFATNGGDTVDDHFKTHDGEQKEVVASEVPEVTGSDGEIEEKTPLIVDSKKQSTVTMDGDVVFDHFKTDTAHADEQKEVTGIVTEVPDELTGTDDEVVEEKAIVITEDMPNQGTVPSVTHTMDGCVKENHFGTGFGHGNEQKKAITADIEPEVSRAQDGGARKENALLDDVTESLFESIITTEPSVCKNSSEKNTAEPMSVLEEKGVKVARESEDLTKLTLGQLRAKLKRKLNAKKNKEAKKRVALARVDENVCRSHAKGQQQNMNLQQH